MKKSKLKQKIGKATAIILGIYVIALIINPTTLMILLPIIISASVLTIGIPTYAILKHSKESLEKISKQQTSSTNQELKKQKTKILNETITTKKQITNKTTDLIDNIVNDDNLTPSNKKQMLEIFRAECEQNTPKMNQTKKPSYGFLF